MLICRIQIISGNAFCDDTICAGHSIGKIILKSATEMATFEDQKTSEKKTKNKGLWFPLATYGKTSVNFQKSSGKYDQGTYNLVDVAAILTHSKYRQDIDKVIHRAQLAGVSAVIIPGMDVKSSKKGYQLSLQYPSFVFFTAGVHPHNAKLWSSNTIRELEELVQKPECVGIGEVGLDFMRGFSPEKSQLDAFEKQIQLAIKYQKPLLLHERQTHEPFMKIIKDYYSQLPKTVVHCFTGTVNDALEYIGMGFYIGITGFAVRPDNKNCQVRKLLENDEIPTDKILLETDSPFMFPTALNKANIPLTKNSKYHLSYCNHQRMEPCGLPAVTEIVAHIMNTEPWELAEVSSQNAMRFFGLDSLPFMFMEA